MRFYNLSYFEFDSLTIDDAMCLSLAIPTLISEEDSRMIETTNFTNFNKSTRQKIKLRIERPFAQTIDLKELLGVK